MQRKFKVYSREIEKHLQSLLAKRQSIMLLGPRQTGKTTLVNKLLSRKKNYLTYSLVEPQVRLGFESDLEKLIREVKAIKPKIFFIDEVQKVPKLLDAVQYLIDQQQTTFILSGSSARKLRRSGVNLLPGRVVRSTLTPFTWLEIGLQNQPSLVSALNRPSRLNQKIKTNLKEQLLYGSLPNSLLTPNLQLKWELLLNYSQIYLEEEIRAEALTRNLGTFARFLELAALESGTAPNFSKLSLQSGASIPAISEYYHLLEDTLIVERLDPYLKSPRKRVFSTSRYYFFDIGVRNALARLQPSDTLLKLDKGRLFEHFIILELIRRSKLPWTHFQLYYWRTHSGLEVDCVVETNKGQLIPIEIKAGKKVNHSDIKGLKAFLKEHPQAKQGYLVTQIEKPQQFEENILAIPWQQL